MASCQSLASGMNFYPLPSSDCKLHLAPKFNENTSTDKKQSTSAALNYAIQINTTKQLPARPQCSPFDSLQSNITSVLKSNNTSPLPQLRSILNQYSSDPAHWTVFAHADPTKQYTRNLVFEVTGIFNLILLVWTPGKASPVHDHADSHCLMKILKEDLRERRYDTPVNPGLEGPLVKISDLRYKLNQVAYMSDQLGLHDISNPSQTEYAVSLHLYFPPNAALKGCNVYDLENGGARHVMQGAYDNAKSFTKA